MREWRCGQCCGALRPTAEEIRDAIFEAARIANEGELTRALGELDDLLMAVYQRECDCATREPDPPSIPKWKRYAVIDRDGLVCGICKKSVELADVQIDHIYPRSRGGSHAFSNLQVAHSRCNSGKRDRV